MGKIQERKGAANVPKIAYKDVKFRADSLALIDTANDIISEYDAQGYNLTLRQLYYQMVARGYIENTMNSYKRIENIINDARLSGLIDWYSVTDRTRNMRCNSHWDNPSQIIRSAVQQYAIDLREGQPNYIEVWVEKEALVEVVAKACRKLDVPYFACRGYVSQSEMWAASRRFKEKAGMGGEPHIIHLGDHDPSGIDMTRDIQERMDLFEAYPEVHRIALNLDQIETYNPPPNPAKLTDSRCSGYMKLYGNESWELDALNPKSINDLIEAQIAELTDWDKLEEKQAEQDAQKKTLQKYADMAKKDA